MAHVYCFSRNRATGVEQVDEKMLKASCRLQDTLTDALVEVTVKVTDLEIMDVRAEVRRSKDKIADETLDSLRKARGVRVGPGMVKILKGLIGDPGQAEELLFMLEECCQAVILSFTKPQLAKAPKGMEKGKDYYAGMLKDNPRLYDSCIAFAPDSPLVEGYKGEAER